MKSLLAALLIAPSVAFAGPLDGVWTTLPKSECPSALKQDGFMVFDKKTIGFPEGLCSVVGEASKDGRTHYNLSCEGSPENGKWQDTLDFSVSGDVMTTVYDGAATTYTRCPAK